MNLLREFRSPVDRRDLFQKADTFRRNGFPEIADCIEEVTNHGDHDVALTLSDILNDEWRPGVSLTFDECGPKMQVTRVPK